jgi:hypothetical protein
MVLINVERLQLGAASNDFDALAQRKDAFT